MIKLTFLIRDLVGKLLKYVTSSKINQQYAKAREADKKYKEAAEAYEAARDYENAIRLAEIVHFEFKFRNSGLSYLTRFSSV